MVRAVCLCLVSSCVFVVGLVRSREVTMVMLQGGIQVY